MKKLSATLYFIFGSILIMQAQENKKDSTQQSMVSFLQKHSEIENQFLKRSLQRKNISIDSIIVGRHLEKQPRYPMLVKHRIPG